MKNSQETLRDTTQSIILGNDTVTLERTLKLLRITGKDPIGMLNAILTNDVLKEGNAGVYAMLLNPKGRIQTDLRVLKSGEDVLVATEPEGFDAAHEILGRYAPFSRAKLEELADWRVLGVYGPAAGELLGLDLPEHATSEVSVDGITVLAARVTSPVLGYDLISPSENLSQIQQHLTTNGATPTTPETYETARIEASIPRFGLDITPENFPGETGVLKKAVSFEKGCYPGQETVARMHYRGHPNKDLYRFACESDDLQPGMEIVQGDKAVGTITSVAPLSVEGKIFSLGYLSRKVDLEAPMTAGGVAVSPLESVQS
ncbi:MAG: YgfZ/GcvT domain-containing protein [Rubrobacteraceae bacterium]